MATLPKELEAIFENLTGFQRTYCEYRSKGLTQALAAEKAGSQGKDRATLASTGWAVENLPGVKDYINYLQLERAKVLPIDELELIDKLRKTYELSIENGSFKDANKALELMGTMIGIFGAGKSMSAGKPRSTAHGDPEGSASFKDEGADADAPKERMAKLQAMMRDIKTSTKV